MLMVDKIPLLNALASFAKDEVISRLSKDEKTMFLLFFCQSYSLFSSKEIVHHFKDSINFILALQPNDMIFCCYILLHSSWKSFYNLLWEPLVLYLNKKWEDNHALFIRFIGYLFSDKCSLLHSSMPLRSDGRFSTHMLSTDFDNRICQILDFRRYKQSAQELVCFLLFILAYERA